MTSKGSTLLRYELFLPLVWNRLSQLAILRVPDEDKQSETVKIPQACIPMFLEALIKLFLNSSVRRRRNLKSCAPPVTEIIIFGGFSFHSAIKRCFRVSRRLLYSTRT